MIRSWVTIAGICLVAAGTVDRARALPFSDEILWGTSQTNSVSGLAAGDLDRDGDLDLVCAHFGSRTDAYLNHGGQLSATPDWQTANVTSATCVALGDIDRDGDLDLLLGDGNGFVAVYRHDGLALESSPSAYIPVPGVRVLALGDLDGDNYPDLVCGSRAAVDTAFRNVEGSIAPEPMWASLAADNTEAIALGDLDGDGDLDLVCASDGQKTCTYLNSGDTLEDAPFWVADNASNRFSIALADMDLDGDLDLACADYGAPARTLANDGSGRFGAAWDSGATVYSGREIVLLDADADGLPDLGVVSADAPACIYRNTGGGFGAMPAWTAPAGAPAEPGLSVLAADFTGDAAPEFVVGGSPGRALVFENRRPPLAAQPSWRATTAPDTRGLAAADVDRDGFSDVAFADFDDRVRIVAGSPAGLGAATIWENIQPDATNCVAIGDLDGDGWPEIVLGNSATPVAVYRNEHGSYGVLPIWTSGNNYRALALAIGDVNGDGLEDLVTGSATQPDRLYLNDGDGPGAVAAWESTITPQTRALALGDLNGDGFADLVCARFNYELVAYLGGNGGFNAEPDWTAAVAAPVQSLALGDIDADGDTDLVCGAWFGRNVAYLNNGSGLAVSPGWSAGADASCKAISLADVDNDGDLDLISGNRYEPSRIYLNSPAGLSPNVSWETPDIKPTSALAVADIDGDGSMDLAIGADRAENRVYRGMCAPPRDVRGTMPNGSSRLGAVRIARVAENELRVDFTAVDAEGDNVQVVAEYQFEGEAAFAGAEIDGVAGHRLGPFAASAAGSDTFFTWRVERFPDDTRPAVLRLRLVETPGRLPIIFDAATYHHRVGRIRPARPTLRATPDEAVFGVVSVGDTASVSLHIANAGNRLLLVDSVDLPGTSLTIDEELPLPVEPGAMRAVNVRLHPVTAEPPAGPLMIVSNDPRSPRREIGVAADIRDLLFSSVLFGDPDSLSIGQSVTIVVQPQPGARVEHGAAYYRPTGAAAFSSASLLPVGADFYATIPAEDVTERGLEYYLEVVNSGVTRRLPATAPDDVVAIAVERPTGAVLTAQPNHGQIVQPGRDLNVLVDLPTGAIFVAGELHYRAGGEAEYQVATIDSVAGLLMATVPAASVTASGVECRAVVSTITTRLDVPAGGAGSSPLQVRTTISDLTEVGAPVAGRYRMFSIPLDFGDGERSLADLLFDDLGDYAPAFWRLFRYDSATRANIEYTPEATGFVAEPGRAFWLISRGSNIVDSEPVDGLSVPTGSPWEIELAPGWNLVANPFAFPVSWTDLTGTEDLSEPVAFDPSLGRLGAYAEQPPAVLEPFGGVFVRNFADEPRILSIPPRRAALEAPAAATAAPPVAVGWRADIRLVVDGEPVDAVSLGASPLALDGSDPLDGLAPPPAPGAKARIELDNEDWLERPGRYRRDIRAVTESGHAWRVLVTGLESGIAFTLDGCTAEGLPAGQSIRLFDLERGTAIDPGSASGLEFVSRGASRPYRMIVAVGTTAYLEGPWESVAATPAKAVLDRAAPNPFNGATAIRFGLALPARVDLAVFDVSGRRVATIVDGERLAAGFHARAWGGHDDSGRQVASGVYFCRMCADGAVLQERLVYVK